MRILAVDISGVFSQFWEVDSGRGRDFDAPRQNTINAVRRWREGHDRVAICCDSGKSFRSQILSSYKANRPDRGEAYRNQIRLTIEALASDGCSVFRAPKYKGELYAEADDVIGSLCAWSYESGHTVTILSSDKDLMQLVADTVSLVRPLDKEHITFGPAEVKAKLGIEPHLVPHWLALAGDASDNYKPYQGIGDKRAIELLSAAGHALAVFEGAVNVTELTRILGSKLAESLLAAGAEPARKALEVATVVRDLPLDFETLTGEPVVQKIMDVEQVETQPPLEQKQQATTQAALAIPRPSPIDRNSPWALQPTGQKGLVDFAGYVVDSRLFPNIKDQAAAIVVIAWGQNLGIPAMIALSQAYVVHGRVGWGAQLIAGLIKNNPSCIKFYVAETDDKHATVIYQRRGEPEGKYVFTLDRAQKMGVIKAGGPWEKIPATMCRWAAMRECARMVWPDVVTGVYTPDEIAQGELPEEMIATMVSRG